ncbi:TRAP transporter substrate-binding protein [Virgibacillus kimchii]
MSKKLQMLGFVLFVSILVLAACGGEEETAADPDDEANGESSGYSGESYQWSIGYNTGEGTVRDVASRRFAEIVEEETDGQVTFEFFPDEVLGSEQEMAEQVQTGALEFQAMGGGMMSNEIPEFGVPGLPFLLEDYEEAYALLDGPLGQKWADMGEDHGIKVLAHLDSGFAHVTTNGNPIHEPSDFEGLTMRAPNGPQYIEPFRAFGASVSTMPFTEVYLGLEQGVVDGQFNPLDPIHSSSMHEVQDYLALTNILYYHNKFIVNVELWNSLDAELQEIIEEAADIAQEESREFTQGIEEEMLEELEPHFEEITEPDLAPFQEALEPLYENEFPELFGEEAVAEAMEWLEEYRENK